MMFSLVFLLLCIIGAVGQFPKPCTTEEALRTRCCCPRTKDGSLCGFASGRGRCQLIKRTISFAQNDDRLDWPYQYYDLLCICNDPYYGFDCGDCKYGYYGETCTLKKALIRREIREIPHQEKLKFLRYINLAKKEISTRHVVLTAWNRTDKSTFRFVEASVYNVFAWMHYYSFKPFLINYWYDESTHLAHEGPGFPTWHRWYLLFLEREIQCMTKDYNFVLPYYDWSTDYNGCSICEDGCMGSSDYNGLLSSSSLFGNWKSMCSGDDDMDKYCLSAEDENLMDPLSRKPGSDPLFKKLPTAQQVEDALKWSAYDTPPYNMFAKYSFRNCLEGYIDPAIGNEITVGLHNLFHMYMVGTVSEVHLSSNDPIFIVHHAFVDKLFERWIVIYNATSEMFPHSNITGHRYEDNIVPSFPPVTNKYFLRRSESFGYTYSDYSPVAVPNDNFDYPTPTGKYTGK